MDEWKEYKLDDLIHIKHDFAFKGKYITNERNKNILVTPGNFHVGSGFKSDKFKYFTSEFPDEYILNTDDIVVTMTDLSIASDTLGYSAKIPKSIKGERYLHNQRIGLVEFKINNISKDYIYWLMRTRDYQWFIISSASGTSIMHTAPKRIYEYEFRLPPLPEQTVIASVLSSLDDKIDLLHRQNETLEKIAETLFRQWFIEEAEEDWKEVKLELLINIGSGKGLKKEFFVDNGLYPILGANGEIGRTDNFLFNEKLIYTGRVGTLGNIFRIENEKVWLSDNTLIIRPKRFFNFVYFLLKVSRLQNFNIGSTQPLIKQSDIKEINLLLPGELLLIKFEELCDMIFKKINQNKTQIRTLIQLRDTLLPKLINGEVRVKL